jgi:toxin YoeB
MFELFYTRKAKEDINFFKKNSAKDFKKCKDLLDSICTNPKAGIGHPKPLSNSEGIEIWSRKVNKKDRMVYEIIEEDNLVVIHSTRSHYGDK